MTRFATIDIGTNSVRLLVADADADPPQVLHADLSITRLGEGLDAAGVIRPEAALRTLHAVRRFARDAEQFGVRPFAFGTAALREADNGTEVAREIEKQCGVAVAIFTGRDEALATLRGVAVGHKVTNRTMILDIGGGSTEFILPQGTSDAVTASLPLGSVRQTERHLQKYPPSDTEFCSLKEEISARVEEGTAYARSIMCDRIIGVAGSVTQIVALELEMEAYDRERVDGFILTSDVIEKWCGRFRSCSLLDLRGFKGMVAKRAETILAGTTILFETMRRIGVDKITVSEFDSLWGSAAFYRKE